MNREIDVLQALRAHLDKEDVDFAAHLMERIVRHADAARLSQPLQASSDIDAIAKDVIALDDDVTEVDADPKRNAPFFWNVGGLAGHRHLYLDRAAHGVDYARKL